MSEVSIVTATEEHLDDIVALHMESFPPDRNIVTAMGPAAVRRTYRWFMRHPGAVLFVALDEGRLVGLNAIAARAYARRLSVWVLPWAIAGTLRHPGLLFSKVLHRRAARLFPRSRPPLPPGARGAYIAVAFDARNRGIGGALKRAQIDWARDQGAERLIAGVHRDNLASRRIQERAGYVEVPELRRGDMLTYVLPVTGTSRPEA